LRLDMDLPVQDKLLQYLILELKVRTLFFQVKLSLKLVSLETKVLPNHYVQMVKANKLALVQEFHVQEMVAIMEHMLPELQLEMEIASQVLQRMQTL